MMKQLGKEFQTTEAQREIWASMIMDENATLCFNISVTAPFTGPIDKELFKQAYQQLQKNHDALRMIFSDDGLSFIISDIYQSLSLYDFTDKTATELEDFKHNEVQKKLDVTQAPGHRAFLLKLNPNEFILVLTVHRLACDLRSLAQLLSSLTKNYDLLKSNEPLSQNENLKFSDYAFKASSVGKNELHKEYWLKEFESPIAVNSFPVDFKRPSFRTFNSRRHDVCVPDTLVASLRELGTAHNYNFKTVLMTVYKVFLYKLTKSDDIVVGMPSSSFSEDIRAVGPFEHLLPLKASFNSQLSFLDCMKQVDTKISRALDHATYSYGQLIRDLKLSRAADKMTLLNTVFDLNDFHLNSTPRDFENFELTVNVVEKDNSLVLECQYNTNLFNTATLENWTSSILELMNLVVDRPEAHIGELDLNFLKIPASLDENASPSIASIIRNSYIEDKIKDIWSQVLLTSKFSVDDDFFRLGGHSLKALELANLMAEEFKIGFTIKDIFENPTVVLLSQKISTNVVYSKSKLPEPIATELKAGPVSPNQMQVWYLEQINPNANAHNIPLAIRISSLNVLAFEQTIHYLIARHPSFRTIVNVEENTPVQKILSAELPQFRPSFDLVQIKREELTEIIKTETQVLFDLKNAPLMRAKLYKIDDSDSVALFVFHQMIWDQRSWEIFINEFKIIYKAVVHNQSPSLDESLGLNVIDFSHWLQNLVNEKILVKDLSYWEEKLAAPLPILSLPQDYKRPLENFHKGAVVSFSFSQSRIHDIKLFAETHNYSLGDIFLTAFKIALAKYCTIDDIIVGLPVQGRYCSNAFKTIGNFANIVALRTEISLNLSFEENLKKVSFIHSEAREHQLAPFQLVLNKLNYTRDPGRTPIYQAYYSYEEVGDDILFDNDFAEFSLDHSVVNTDIDLTIKAGPKMIEGDFTYRSDLFREVSIERFKETFFHILDELVENFQKPLNIIKSIPHHQEEQIILEWNNTWKKHPENVPFHQIFEKLALSNPSAVAIETHTEKMTYENLNIKANRCANKLLAFGIGKGDLVGISLKRTPDMVAVILGVLKVGAGYVPLDPGFPQDRLDYMIANSTPKMLITEEALTERFTGPVSKILVSQFINDSLLDSKAIVENISLASPIYVIYTSGSTGNPKGVEITHGCVTNFLHSMKEIIGCDENDKLLAVTTLSFDIAVLELFLPLISGATIFLASSTDVMDGGVLKATLESKDITIMQATPSTWRLLLASGWTGSSELKILCGGEAFPIDLARKLVPICKDVWNMYGPTETTVWSACKKLSLNEDKITVGKPIANTTLYVLDQNRFMQPIGVTGELFIGGHGLSNGYFGREDLTSERFMNDPFMPGMKMYATGDLARFTYNGEIECLGRNDGQVKVRGYRIELGEIEAEIQRISNVSEVAVITKEVRPEDVRILAYVSSKELPLEERDLRDILGKKLPNYMLPSHFIFLKEIPKTLNGKIDKKALPKFSIEIEEELVGITQNESGIEAALRSMWMDVLGTKNVKDSDNFFDIGGNSLLAVELFFRIKERFKLNLPLAALLQSDNFGMFARDISEKINPSDIVNYRLPIHVPTLFKSLIAIRSIGEKTPLFCFHGVGGNVLNYVKLVAVTKDERPLYALQSMGMDGVTPLVDNIEEMAKNYISEMKIVQPEGPYLLAGGSMGGMIAYEVATQLSKSGDKIEKLIMFDTFGPSLDLKAYDADLPRPFLARLKASFYRRLEGMLMKIKTSFLRTLGLQVPLKTLLVEIERKNYNALWNYTPQVKFKGDLYLIRSKTERTGWYSDPVMGWKDIIEGEIKTYEIEGTHENFIESSELITVIKKIL